MPSRRSRAAASVAFALASLATSSPLRAQAPAEVAEAGPMANPTAHYELPTVEVIGIMPLPGVGLPLDKVPANVQAVGAAELERQAYDNLAEALNGSLGSVNVNDTQGNPYQLDVNARGFTASPILGTPQGLSVFVDGVRVNESFGDVVNWDLIPQNAIANLTLVPAANPQFGLNTLGGAISVVTKSGFQFPGTRFAIDGGSARRRQFEFESGGHGDFVDWFVAGNLYRDNGWGDANPSRVKQLFGKTGYQDDDTDIDLSLTLADNTMQGNQTIPLSFFDNLHQIYTAPDSTRNRLAMLDLKGSQLFGGTLTLSGNTYFRRVETDIFNSNVNGDYATATDASGNPCPGQSPFLPDCPDAQNVTNAIVQHTWGLAGQLADSSPLGGVPNLAAVGLSFDHGRTDFSQAQQDALAASDRTTLSTQPVVPQIGVAGTTEYTGLYATDTWSASEQWALTVSGRYNRARVKTEYVYADPTNYPTFPESGDYTYSRFNPALGVNFNPRAGLGFYGSYTEGMRAPTPVELTCASPTDPCALPNAFSTDPYLKKVVSRTFELGARGLVGTVHWSAAVFQTRLQDDILFIADPSTPTQGYFTNVGNTQRRGLELGGNTELQGWKLAAHYTLVDATFQSPFAEISASSAADADGVVVVPSGSRIPGVARHVLRLQADYAVEGRWSVGGGMQAQSSTFARGDEANNDVNGQVPGFAVFNLHARVNLMPDLELGLHVDNLFNRVYSTFGALATNLFNQAGHGFDNSGQGTPEQFRSIGAPRLGYVGLTWWFDRAPDAPAGAANRD